MAEAIAATLHFLDRLPLSTAVLLLVVLVLMGLGVAALSFAFKVFQFVVVQRANARADQARHEIADAASCNMPPHVVEALRSAIELQKEDVAAREASDRRAIESRARLEAAITELTRMLNRGAEKLAVWMASQRRGGD